MARGNGVMGFIHLLFRYWFVYTVFSLIVYGIVVVCVPDLGVVFFGVFLFFFVVGLIYIGKRLSRLFDVEGDPPFVQ